MSTTPHGIIFEPVARRHRAALAGKIAAGTLALTALAALGVEGASQLSTHGSEAAPLAIAPAPPVVTAADYAAVSAFPATVAHWRAIPAERLAAALHKHAVVHRAKPVHVGAAAHRTVSHTAATTAATTAPAAHHSPPAPSTSHSTAPAGSHPVTSWHSSWHSSTAADGTTTKVTSKTTTTTVGGHPTTVTHTATTVTPPASHAAPPPAAPTHPASNAGGASKH
jgi:hypothetical protein